MEIKQIWMSPSSGKNNHYALHLSLGVVGIVLLMLLLISFGIVVSFSLGLPRKATAMGLCVACTILALVLARRLGRYAVHGATIFFLTAEDRLFALDARELPFWGSSGLQWFQAAAQVQEYLRRQARNPSLPPSAWEIGKVLSLRERFGDYRVVCQVHRPGRRVFRSSFSFSQNWDRSELLLRQLERRELWQAKKAAPKNRLPALAASLAGAAILLGICILSHPAQGILPRVLYFPCLAGELAAVTLVCIFWTMHTRGE